jgi:hypothetical protein
MMTNPSPDSLTDNRRSCKFRWLGFLPLTFFAARVVEYVWVAGTPEQILWCCHLSNLLLAGGIFLHRPPLVRIASLWLLVGLPPWALDMILTRLVTPVSIFTHLGGTLVALYALQRVRVTGRDWLPGLLCFLIMQQVTRLLTPPGPLTNVNVAHFAYGPWQPLFSSYWLYIVINAVLAGGGLWLLERLLASIFPSTPEKRAS